MLRNEKLNNSEEEKREKEQDKISPEPTKPKSTPSERAKSFLRKLSKVIPLPAPSKEVKPPEKPVKKEKIKPKIEAGNEQKPEPEQKPELESKPESEKKPKLEPEKKLKKKSQKKKVVPKEKIIKIDSKSVLMVPSGFEIMTKNGWKPIMMRADKIHKTYKE